MSEQENKILEVLTALHKRFDGHEKEHAKEFALNEYKLDKMCGLVDKHNAALYGNGKPGLLTEMSKLKEYAGLIKYIALGVLSFAAVYAFKMIFKIL